jgi:hypothetical protein
MRLPITQGHFGKFANRRWNADTTYKPTYAAHRKTLLNADVHFEGISIHTHTVFEYVTVMVFSSEIPTTEQRLPERVT